MHLEGHNHCFMHYFGVKPLSETLFPPPLMNAGYGARYGCRGGLPYFKPTGWVRLALTVPREDDAGTRYSCARF